jgi:hypothetical protein
MTGQDQSARGDKPGAKPHHKKQDNYGEKGSHSTPPPPPAAQRWAKYMLGFGVSVAVGLAPLLGSKSVPLFSSLLNLIPDSLRASLIPITSALMGLVAVVVQWYSEEDLDRAARRKALVRSVAISTLGALAFYVLSLVVVKTVGFGGPKERDSTTFIVGFARPYKDQCPATVSDVDCIGFLSLDQEKVTQFWGVPNVISAELALCFTYLTFMLGFASAVGIVMYRQGDSNAEASNKPVTSSANSHDDLVHLEKDSVSGSPDDQRSNAGGA